MSLKFLHLNIEGSTHIHRISDFLSQNDIDVLCLQEAPQKFVIEQMPKLGFGYQYFVPMGRWEKYNDNLGLAIISKHPFSYTSHTILSKKGAVNNGDVSRVFHLMEAGLNINDSVYNFLTTHLPVNYPGHVLTEFQLATYTELKNILLTKKSFILTGDFNCPRGVFIFDDLAKSYKDNVPTEITSTIDPVLHRKPSLNLVVDGVFTTQDYKVSELKVLEGLSDHKGIMGSLSIT